MMNCVDEKPDEAADICADLQDHLLNAMLRMRSQNICPTCALYAISMTVAQTFIEHTNCDEKDVVKAGMAGFSRACNIHVSVISENSVH